LPRINADFADECFMDRSPTDGTLKHNELTEIIIGTFYEVYNELGFGFLESVYENSMRSALMAKGLPVRQQAPVAVWFRGEIVGDFKADLVIEEKVILELKSVRVFDESHKTQLLNYLRATEIEVGLLLNLDIAPNSNGWRSIIGESVLIRVAMDYYRLFSQRIKTNKVLSS